MKMSTLARSRMTRPQLPRRRRLEAELLEGRDMPSYAVVGLASLSAADVNDAGQVVGYDYSTGHAALWSEGSMIDLGTLGGYSSSAAAINDAGQVVGYSDTYDGYQHAFKLTPADVDADGDLDWFVDADNNGANDLMTDLGAPYDGYSYANDINDAGQVVGSSWDPYYWTSQAVLWSGGGTYDLGVLPGYTSSSSLAINSDGAVVGYSWLDYYDPAFLWQPDVPNGSTGTLVDLPEYYGTNNQAYGINDAAQIVGVSDTPNSYYQQAVVWEGNTVTPLDYVSGYEAASSAVDVNNSGQIVGSSSYEVTETAWYYDEWYGYYEYTYTYLVSHAAMWQNGAAVDLNDTIDPASGWSLDSASAISDTGFIIGYGSGPDASSYLLIPDNGAPMVMAGNASVDEGDSGDTVLTFTVSRFGSSTDAFSVDFATADGTATAGVDYEAASGTLDFAADQMSQTVEVVVHGNTAFEYNDTVLLNLSNAVGAQIIDTQGIGTIRNDDAAPTITIQDVEVVEGNSGTTPANFTLTMTGDTEVPISVSYYTSDYTAYSWSDYEYKSGSVTFAPTDTTKDVSVNVKGDIAHEADESFVLNLSSSAATILDYSAVATIRNDDVAPTISIENASIDEGHRGTRILYFTVNLSSASDSYITVNYSTADGIALSQGSGNSRDYNAASGSITFYPGQTSQTIGIVIRGDRKKEGNETFFVNLSSPVNATIADAQAIGTITNDD